MRNKLLPLMSLLALMLLLAACVAITQQESGVPEPEEPSLRIVTSGTILANHIYNIAGGLVSIERIVPPGADPHTYEPTPSDAVKLSDAELIIVRGASRPEAVRRRLAAIVGDENKVVLVAPLALEPEDYIYDEFGTIDQHMGGDTMLARKIAAVIRDTLVEHDPANADTYRANYDKFSARIDELDAAIVAVTASIPEENRQLYSYHDSFSYFARRYGYTIVGTLQPHDFSEPSAQDVAAAIELLRELDLPAIFGSSFSPSPVLEQISREADVPIYWYDDDNLPGEPGDPEHSFFYMNVHNLKALAEALGGDPTLIDHIETRNIPETE